MSYREVEKLDPNLQLNVDPAAATAPDGSREESHYLVPGQQADVGLRERIRELIDQQAKFYEQNSGALPASTSTAACTSHSSSKTRTRR